MNKEEANELLVLLAAMLEPTKYNKIDLVDTITYFKRKCVGILNQKDDSNKRTSGKAKDSK